MNTALDPNHRDVKFGRHSNIPDCCIEFYLGEWSKIWPDRWANKEYFRGFPSVGYVPCRKCQAAESYVRIHRCTDACNPFLETIGRWGAVHRR